VTRIGATATEAILLAIRDSSSGNS
jgi:hypothetical protein